MAKLIIHRPDDNRQFYNLPPGSPVTLGRAEDNTVRLDDDTVSRHHARLHPGEDGACVVEDLRSANGTTVNGLAVERSDLQDGDRLAFGEVITTYQVAEADAARLAATEAAPGEVFGGRYRLESALGETDEYQNFLATDLALGSQRVSLKIFGPGVISQAGGFERVWREFARLRAVPVHPHLVRLLDFGRWRGVSFLAAEWIEGHPLLDLLRRHGALSGADAFFLARLAALATDYARAHAVLAPDLDLRATLAAFASPVSVPEWERLWREPLKSWPPFSLKVSPRLFVSGSPSRWPLGAMVCELLGHPASTLEPGRAVRIASLGEQGNATLAAGFDSAGETFGGDAAFIDALAKDAGIRPLMPGA